MMNRIDNSGEGIARLGRDEDNYLAHVAQGEMVVPPVITPETRQRLEQEMSSMGLDPAEYTVGGGMSINPITGNPEFGWLKKVGKSLKKVAKKVAPIVSVIAPFIPGVGPLMSAAISAGTTKLAGGSWKDALKAGAMSYGGSKLKSKFGQSKFGTKIKGGIGDFFNPAEDATGLFGGKLGPNLRTGIGNLFGGQAGDQAVQPYSDAEIDGMLDTMHPSVVEQMVNDRNSLISKNFLSGGQGTSGLESVGDGTFIDPVTKQIFTTSQLSEMGLLDASGNLQGSALSKLSGSSEGGFDFKSLFGGGKEGQSKLGLIEDMFKGRSSDSVRDDNGGMFGGMFSGKAGAAGIAALIAKLAYDDAKNFKGIPQTPLTTTDQLGRYNIAAESARQAGTAMPNRTEFGLNPSTLPILQGGGFGKTARKPRGAAQGGIMAFAQGGAVAMANGGEIPIDPANFPVMNGQIDGPGTETSDDIPAMLSDGEFVMTAKAVKGAGGYNVDDSNGILTLSPNGEPSRDSGTRVMYKLMEHFGGVA